MRFEKSCVLQRNRWNGDLLQLLVGNDASLQNCSFCMDGKRSRKCSCVGLIKQPQKLMAPSSGCVQVCVIAAPRAALS